MVDISQYIDTLRIISAVGLGLLAGASASTTTMFLPPMYKTLQPAARLKIWSDLFDRGKTQIPPIATVVSVSLGLAAYYANPVVGRGIIGEQRKLILALAAISAGLMGPWTGVVMMPNIKKLKSLEVALDSGKKDDSTFGLESDAGIVKWDRQHLVRTVAYSLAFVLSVLELAIC